MFTLWKRAQKAYTIGAHWGMLLREWIDEALRSLLGIHFTIGLRYEPRTLMHKGTAVFRTLFSTVRAACSTHTYAEVSSLSDALRLIPHFPKLERRCCARQRGVVGG